MEKVFLKKQNSTNKKETKENKILIKRKIACVLLFVLFLCFGLNTQAYAAENNKKAIIELWDADAYEYKLMDRVAAGSSYPSIQGLALGNGNAYVLKTNGKSGTECKIFAGTKTNLKEIATDTSVLKHGNDMTYSNIDGKLYVAPMTENYIVRMSTKGTVEAKIKTSYPVGSIACWQNYDKANKKIAFILKNHKDGSFHIVEVNGTTLTEICQFQVNAIANQGICMYNGYLYVTSWDNKSGNSYVYRVRTKMSAILKEKSKGRPIISYADKIVTLDKRHLLKAAGVTGTGVKVEIESIAFLDGYLYFTANANYKDATKAHKQHSLDGLYKVKKRLA